MNASIYLSIPSSKLSHSSSDISRQSFSSFNSFAVRVCVSSNSFRISAALIVSFVFSFPRMVLDFAKASVQFIFLFMILSREPKSAPSVGEIIDFMAFQLPHLLFTPSPLASLYWQYANISTGVAFFGSNFDKFTSIVLLPLPVASFTRMIVSSLPGFVTKDADIPYPIFPAFAKPIPRGVTCSSSAFSSCIFSLECTSLNLSVTSGSSDCSICVISIDKNFIK